MKKSAPLALVFAGFLVCIVFVYSCGGGGGGGGGSGSSVTIVSVAPSDGLSTASRDVVVTGTGFDGTETISAGTNTATCSYVNSTQLDCTFPNNSGTPAAVDVLVQNGGGDSASLPSGYTYTGVFADPGVSFWCGIAPASTTTTAGVATEDIYGRIYISGTTDLNNTPVASIQGQVGFGPDGSDPQAVNFTWFDAIANPGYDFSQNNDEQVGTITPESAGTYDYAYRFSMDGGLNHYYFDVNGSDDGYSTANAGNLTVN